MSNEPPRGELRDSPNDDHRVQDEVSFVFCFVWVLLKRLPSVSGQVFRFEGKTSP